MRIRLLSVGRPRDREAVALHDRYAQRILRLGVDYRTAWVKEVRPGGRYDDEHVRQREARCLIERLGDERVVVALDRGGQSLTSEDLSRRLEGWAARGATLVVGGPLGLHSELLQAAATVWSLSQLTFPHELARVLVAEQIYRALTLQRGLPYHK